MAAKANKIEIILTAIDQSVSKTFGQVNKAMAAGEAASRKYGRGMDALKAPINAITSSLARLGAGLGAGFAVTKYIQTAEAMTNVNARLKLVTSSSAELTQVQGELYAMSQKTGTSYQANADTYQKLAIGLKAAGTSSKELIGISEAVAKSLIVNGSSAGMASSFLLQFGQAMGSGVLQGEEFRAMMESNSFFGQMLAKALDTDIAGLRKMSQEGKLTTDVIRQAVPKMTEEINAAFAKMPLTIGRAMTMLANAFDNLVNGSNKASGATGKIAAAIKDFVSYLEQNGGAIETWIVQVTTMAGELIKAAWEWKKFITGFVLSTLAVSAIASLVTAISGINMALKVMLGPSLTVWATSTVASLKAVQLSLAATGTAFGVLGLAMAAAYAGYKVGDWVQTRETMKGIADATEELTRNQQIVAGQYREISAATGVTVTSMKELDQAVKDQKIHYDELTGAWKAGAKDQAAATVTTAATMKQAQGAALEAMKKKYQEYAAEVRRLQDEIKNRELSLYDQLRTMARTGMTGIDAWQDLKQQAEDYEKTATDAARAGDFQTAIDYADKAKELYAQLNNEVKDGDQVLVSQTDALKTAMDGVERSGQIGIDALTAMQTKAAQNMDELVEQSGFQDLTEGMNEAEKQWLDNWSKMKAGALKEVAAVERKIVELTKDRYVTVYVKEVVKKATGGLIQRFARGGKLAGYGGGDRISALLEAGEFVVRKEAVAKFGTGMFAALNSLRLPDIPRFAVGGLVGGGAGPSGDTININLSLPGGGAAVRVSADRQSAAELLRQVQRLQRLSA